MSPSPRPPEALSPSFEPANAMQKGERDESDPRAVGDAFVARSLGSHERAASAGDENGSDYFVSGSLGSGSRVADNHDDQDQVSRANLADRVAYEEGQALRRLKQFGYRVVILVAVGLGLAAFFVTQAEQTSAFQTSVRYHAQMHRLGTCGGTPVVALSYRSFFPCFGSSPEWCMHACSSINTRKRSLWG
jgi:hypothetical protein